MNSEAHTSVPAKCVLGTRYGKVQGLRNDFSFERTESKVPDALYVQKRQLAEGCWSLMYILSSWMGLGDFDEDCVSLSCKMFASRRQGFHTGLQVAPLVRRKL